MSLLFEGVTSSLLRDMITILYEPLAKVYKTANVYNSVIDFKEFIDDLIEVVQKAEQQGIPRYKILLTRFINGLK
jgi:Domain of unknown function in PX-proteins (DUF3818)